MKTLIVFKVWEKILLRVKHGDLPPEFDLLTDVAISSFRTNHCSCCFSHKFDSPLHSLTVAGETRNAQRIPDQIREVVVRERSSKRWLRKLRVRPINEVRVSISLKVDLGNNESAI